MARSPFETLHYLLALSGRDAGLRAALGDLTQARAARAAGVSRRTLMRYLRGERTPPDTVGARLIDLAENLRAEAHAYFKERAVAQRVPYQGTSRKPLSVQRYARPMIVAGAPEPSRIIVVDVNGLTNARVAEILVEYWRHLKTTNESWDLRLQANIERQTYFGERVRDIQDRSLRRYVARTASVELWLPPQPFVFVRPRSRRGVRFLNYPNARAMLGALNESMYHPIHGDYRDRLPEEFTFSRLAFIPRTAPARERRYQKRLGKH